MKKFLILVLVLAVTAAFVISCAKSSDDSPAAPGAATSTATATATTTQTTAQTPVTYPYIIDDFEDSDLGNLHGGTWYTQDDQAFGGGNTMTVIYIAGGAPSGTTVASFQIQPNNWGVNAFLTEGAGYYGFAGVYTTLTATNFTGSTGIRLYLKTYSHASDSEYKINIWLGSKYEREHGVNSHFRAPVTVATGASWTSYSIPWSAFTLSYVYDTYYPAHPQNLSQVLTEVEKIGFDEEYHSVSLGASGWSQVMYIDDVTVY